MNGSANCSHKYAMPTLKYHDFFEKPLIGGIVLNVVLAVSATFGNGMIIVAILTSQNLQTPSYLLITSLAFTDLLVGLVYHPLLALQCFHLLLKNVQGICDRKLFSLFRNINALLVLLSYALSMLISIDRVLALTLRHRYRIKVTVKRVRMVIIGVCIGAPAMAIPVMMKVDSVRTRAILAFSLMLIPLLVTSAFYIKSFVTLHRYTVQLQAQQPNPSQGSFDVAKYRKILKTMLAVFGFLVLCFLPGIVTSIMRASTGMRFKAVTMLAWISRTVFGLHSSINPVIYLIRFTDIRQACKQLLTKLKNKLC